MIPNYYDSDHVPLLLLLNVAVVVLAAVPVLLLVLLVLGVGVMGTLGGYALGPWIIRKMYATDLHSRTLAMLALGSALGLQARAGGYTLGALNTAQQARAAHDVLEERRPVAFQKFQHHRRAGAQH
mgnify:CR=1 FL=1